MGDNFLLWKQCGGYCNLHFYLVDIVESSILILKVIGHYCKMGKDLGDIVISPKIIGCK